MSTEVVIDETVDPLRDEIRAQMKICSAVRAYIDALEKWESASKDYNESCVALREITKPSTTIVVRWEYGRHYGKYYLLKSDDKGNFEVEPVKVI